MKQIALMGLMAAVVAVGLYGCSSGADTIGDGGNNRQDASIEVGTDGGTADANRMVNCGPSPTGKGGDMCLVPEGQFMMGCNTAVDTECFSSENPYHPVSVPEFKIDKYELTMGEYQACVDTGACSHHFDDGTCYVWNGSSVTQVVLPYNFRDVSKPVVCVEWAQAKEYCTWAGKRLPTEAEWEMAARGTDGRKYPWGNAPLDCDHAVHSANGCSNSSTAPVGSKPLGACPYGAEDMVGNVYEWVEDWYLDTYTGAPSDGSAWVTPTGIGRVIRGGSWGGSYSGDMRASRRDRLLPTDALDFAGFRCAWSQ